MLDFLWIIFKVMLFMYFIQRECILHLQKQINFKRNRLLPQKVDLLNHSDQKRYILHTSNNQIAET